VTSESVKGFTHWRKRVYFEQTLHLIKNFAIKHRFDPRAQAGLHRMIAQIRFTFQSDLSLYFNFKEFKAMDDIFNIRPAEKNGNTWQLKIALA